MLFAYTSMMPSAWKLGTRAHASLSTRTLIYALTVLIAFAPTSSAICNLPPPAEEPPTEDPPTDPPPAPPPNIPPDTRPPPAPPQEGPPTTPPDAPPPNTPPEAPPTTPPDDKPDTPTPRRPGPRSGPRTPGTAKGPSYGASWRIWWELNREHLLGLRQTIRGKEVISGGSSDTSKLLDEKYRAKVRDALREIADRATDSSVQAAALRALGRAGDDEDARRFLKVLRKRQQPNEVYESAAIGLGCLPPIQDVAIREDVNEFFGTLLANRAWLKSNTRRVAILALSLRGRDDAMLAMNLAQHCTTVRGNEGEMATLLYACGLTRDPRVQSTVIAGVKGDKLRGKKLGDVARGRAALGLAASGDSSAIPLLARVLKSRGAQVHTRRSAAVGLGMLLRSDKVNPENLEQADSALRRAFRFDRDPLVKGYAAMAMGTACKPIGIDLLRSALEDKDRIVRPYAALALGLAAERAPDGRKIRTFLLHELRRSKDIETTAALSIAVGMSGEAQGREDLYKCLKRKRLNVDVRAPAIQALGLLRRPSPEIEATLTEALDAKSATVVEDASLALGFLGQRSTARMLVNKLVETKSASVQVHMVAAISHLGSTAAIDPLLKVLQTKNGNHTMRESAASALGILVDPRAGDPEFRDPMFEIDAHTSPYGLTVAGRALVLVY
jgi:HEAT repeat protein